MPSWSIQDMTKDFPAKKEPAVKITHGWADREPWPRVFLIRLS